uniref:Uncharacterized protein n=1 Tax=Anguilla anguilla TaxID=7936 RepID=A0A0E9X9C0_ANGAN
MPPSQHFTCAVHSKRNSPDPLSTHVQQYRSMWGRTNILHWLLNLISELTLRLSGTANNRHLALLDGTTFFFCLYNSYKNKKLKLFHCCSVSSPSFSLPPFHCCTEVVAILGKGEGLKVKKKKKKEKKSFRKRFSFFDQKNCKRTKYNTAITYKSSPSFCTFYTVFLLFFVAFRTFVFFKKAK